MFMREFIPIISCLKLSTIDNKNCMKNASEVFFHNYLLLLRNLIVLIELKYLTHFIYQ